MRKSMWLYWGAVALAGLVLIYYLAPKPAGLVEVSQLDLSQAPVSKKSPPEAIQVGPLSVKYLTAEELKRLDLELDLEKIPYRRDLDLDKWAFALFIDAIPAISHPRYTTVAETDGWLHPDDLVLSVAYRDQVRAYPIRILDAHEVVNDRFDDQPVLVSYCPLCGSGVVFVRPVVNGAPLEFGVSGRLYRANLLMYDRATATLWHQLTGEPLAGPLVGQVGALERIPADIVPWETWKASYPQGQVLARPTQVTTPRGTFQRTAADYERYRYEDYRLKQGVGFGVDVSKLDLRGMSAKRKVVGLEVGAASKAYVTFMLKDRGLLNDTLGGRPVLIGLSPSGAVKAFEREVGGTELTFRPEGGALVDEQSGSRWSWAGLATAGAYAQGGARLVELPVTPAFWFAWVELHPDTELFNGQG